MENGLRSVIDYPSNLPAMQCKAFGELTRTQVLELGPRDGSLLWSGLIWSVLVWSGLVWSALTMN